MVEILKKIKSKMTKKQKLFVYFCVFFFVIFLILNYLNRNVNPIIIAVSEAKVGALSVKAVNTAIEEITSDANLYSNLIKIEYNSNNEIVFIQANSIAINSLTRQLATKVQTNLDSMGTSGVQIPIGSFSGLTVLNGIGPKVTIRLIPVGSINCSFISEFETAGINQTNHKIYVNIETRVNLVLPLASKYITRTTQMLICDNIIIGKVPDTYLYTNSLDDALNLVPDGS